MGTANLDIDKANANAMLGYAIGCKHRGLGIGIEAVRSVVNYGFLQFELVRIWATLDARNSRSQRLLETVGMSFEGRLRSHERARDGWSDKLFYGLLREEWATIRGAATAAGTKDTGSP